MRRAGNVLNEIACVLVESGCSEGEVDWFASQLKQAVAAEIKRRDDETRARNCLACIKADFLEREALANTVWWQQDRASTHKNRNVDMDKQWTFTAAQSERGWDVGGFDNQGNVLPQTSYPNATKAGARVLQLMEIGAPVAPQDWPERVEIG